MRQLRRLVACAAVLCLGASAGFLACLGLDSARQQRLRRPVSRPAESTSATVPPNRVAALQAQYNPDIWGILCIPALALEEPLCLGGPGDGYLTHDFAGQPSRWGAPFLDETQTPDSSNRTIYGHNLRDGRMFARLEAFRAADFLRENPFFIIETAQGQERWEFFAALLLPAGGDDFFEWRSQAFAAPETVAAFAAQLKARALCATDAAILPGDRLLSLVTCAYDFEDARLVLFARLRP